MALDINIKVSAENVFYPEDFGAKGDAVGNQDGVIASTWFSSAAYVFTTDDLNAVPQKKLWFSGTDGSPRTITAVNAGAIQVTPSVTGTTGILWLMSTDDTQAVQDACNAARAIQGPDTDETASGGADHMTPSGGVVYLTPGKRYGISNSSASYSGGKISAVTVYRRMYFGGETTSSYQTGLVQLPGSYGHAVANLGSSSHTDFLTLANFSIWCYKEFNPNALNGVHLEIPTDGYDKIDPYNRVENVAVWKSRVHGFYFKGRGELEVQKIQASGCGGYGAFFDSQYDWKLLNSAFGGNEKTGLRIYGGGGQISHTKSFYNGISGGTNDEDCANLVVDGDQNVGSRQGFAFFSNFQCQESRGCSAVIKAGIVSFDSACTFFDPLRVTMSSGTLPTVKAAIYLKGQGARMVDFGNCRVGSSVTVYENPNWPADTYSVYIDGLTSSSGPQENTGNIRTYVATINTGGGTQVGTQYSGTGAVKGGGGISNGTNIGLYIDGVACT